MHTVLTMGSFDPIHPGHIGLFKVAKKLSGDNGKVVVGVNSDSFISSYKKTKTLLDQETRLAIIEEFSCVDSVFLNPGGSTQKSLILKYKPSLLLIGDDWAVKNYYEQIGVDQSWLCDQNITLLYTPRTGPWSSSEIKNKYYDE